MSLPDNQDYDKRISVLEVLQRDLQKHMAEDNEQLDSINRQLIKISTILDHGVTGTLESVSKIQAEMSLIQSKHGLILKAVVWVSGVVITGLVATALKVWFGG